MTRFSGRIGMGSLSCSVSPLGVERASAKLATAFQVVFDTDTGEAAGTRCAAGLGPAAHRRSLRLGRAPTPRPHNGPEDPDHGSRDKVRGKLGHKPMSCDNHQVMHGINLLLRHPAGALEGLFTWSWGPEPVLAGHLQPPDTGRAGSAASPVALYSPGQFWTLNGE